MSDSKTAVSVVSVNFIERALIDHFRTKGWVGVITFRGLVHLEKRKNEFISSLVELGGLESVFLVRCTVSTDSEPRLGSSRAMLRNLLKSLTSLYIFRTLTLWSIVREPRTLDARVCSR